MGRRRLLLLVAGLAVAALAGWLALRPAAPRYNVLLISIDSLVRDRLGVYGHRPEFAPELAISPNLDALAAEGVVCDDAHTTTSWTLPAHMALLSGLGDGSHEVVSDAFHLDPLRRTLAQEFQRAGAETAGFYSGPYLDPRYGFGRGFDRYESGMMPPAEIEAWLERTLAAMREAGQPTGPQVARELRDRLSHFDVTSPRVNRAALDFLGRQRPGRRFFLFLHYFDAHYDYQPDRLEAGLARRFDPDYRGTRDGRNWYFDPAVRGGEDEQGRPRPRLGERDLRHVQALYDAEIHYVDRCIGEILARLRELDLWQETIVCVVSDHGDEFFEHGSIGHRSTLYPEQTEMAWILRVPEGVPPGGRIAELARSYDVAPTLLDYAGLPPLAEAEGRSLRGLVDGSEQGGRRALHRMLAPVGGAPFREAWRDARFAVHRALAPDGELCRRYPGWLFLGQVREDERGAPGFAVYDRHEDPGELQPLPPEDPRVAEALARYRDSFRAGEVRRRALPDSPLELRYAAPLSAEERAFLGALGYTNADSGAGASDGAFPRFAPLPPPGAARSEWRPPGATE